MSAPTYDSAAPLYRSRFSDLAPRTELLAKCAAMKCAKMIERKNQYERVALKFANQLPWWAVAVIHAMEADLDFRAHLHNGDSLRARTIHEPKGRPVTGEPPFTWEESAYDALRYDGWHKVPAERWRDIAGVLYQLEAFNGWGYRRADISTPSPYLWAASNHEQPGKFIADGVFDPKARSKQIGAALLLHTLVAEGQITFRA